MLSQIDQKILGLHDQMKVLLPTVEIVKANRKGTPIQEHLPETFKQEFFSLIDQIVLKMMEDQDYFYSYFLFQVTRQIRLDLASPTGIHFKAGKYIIYFNPVIFLSLNKEQMACSIKHEILHIVSCHLTRAKDFNGKYSDLAINMAMDVVVNKYLDYLPPYATTVQQLNAKYHLALKHFETFEYYVEGLQTAFDLMEVDEEADQEMDTAQNQEESTKYQSGEAEDDEASEIKIDTKSSIETSYDPEKTHNLWKETDLDEDVLNEVTQGMILQSKKGNLPNYLENLILGLQGEKEELPWGLYLHKLMGKIQSDHKKVTTRRNRRQPERLDLRGQLRNHQAQIGVAIDISGSISDEAFNQAMKEVLGIMRHYKGNIILIECDDQIRRTYTVKKEQDLKQRSTGKGATQFNPVFEYANRHKIDMLIYFTDGKGEQQLRVVPRGYKVLWVLAGKGSTLSLKEPYGVIKKLSDVKMVDQTLDMSDVRYDGYSMTSQEPIF